MGSVSVCLRWVWGDFFRCFGEGDFCDLGWVVAVVEVCVVGDKGCGFTGRVWGCVEGSGECGCVYLWCDGCVLRFPFLLLGYVYYFFLVGVSILFYVLRGIVIRCC